MMPNTSHLCGSPGKALPASRLPLSTDCSSLGGWRVTWYGSTFEAYEWQWEIRGNYRVNWNRGT